MGDLPAVLVQFAMAMTVLSGASGESPRTGMPARDDPPVHAHEVDPLGDTVCLRGMPPPPPMLLAARLLVAAAGTEPPSETTTAAQGVEAQPHEPAQPAAAAIDPQLRVHTDRVQASAVQQGLELRVGQGWRRWTIEVSDGPALDQVEVTLRDEAGRIHTRGLTLEGPTLGERSRELAASLALLVEQLAENAQLEQEPPEPTQPPTEPEPGTSAPTGFLGLGPRLALDAGRAPTVDGGMSLAGGTWLAKDHLHPVAELAWARSVAGELRLDALRMGVGVLGGAAGSQGRIWGGAGALMRAQWARATAEGAAHGWGACPAVLGAIQYRGRILVLGAWVGADLVLPPVTARGDAHVLRWSTVRPMATLHVGLRLPPRPRPAAR